MSRNGGRSQVESADVRRCSAIEAQTSPQMAKHFHPYATRTISLSGLSLKSRWLTAVPWWIRQNLGLPGSGIEQRRRIASAGLVAKRQELLLCSAAYLPALARWWCCRKPRSSCAFCACALSWECRFVARGSGNRLRRAVWNRSLLVVTRCGSVLGSRYGESEHHVSRGGNSLGAGR